MNRFQKGTALVCALVLLVSLLVPALAFAETTSVFKLSAPTTPYANADLKKILVYWWEVAGATSYLIYRGTTPSVSTNTVYRTVPAWAINTFKSAPVQNGRLGAYAKDREYWFADTKVTVGTPYFYKIVAVVGGVKSARSQATGAVAYAKSPTVQITKTTTGVKLTWTAVSKATSYYLYRRQWILGGRGDYQFLKEQSARSYVDTTALAGRTYSYAVACYFVSGGVVVDTGFHFLQDYLVPKAAPKK